MKLTILYLLAGSATGEGIDLLHPLDQCRPASAGLPGPGRGRAVDLEDAGSFCGGLGAQATTLIGIGASGAEKIFSVVGSVLGELGDEVQGIQDPEVAADVPQEVFAGWLGASVAERSPEPGRSPGPAQ